jgi:hypothetical protein
MNHQIEVMTDRKSCLHLDMEREMMEWHGRSRSHYRPRHACRLQHHDHVRHARHPWCHAPIESVHHALFEVDGH